ncbi:MAG: Crp/Fnr family transcriptional regulator [Thermonemataceae bacterium]
MAALKERMAQFISLTSEEYDYFYQQLTIKKVKKKEKLLQEGEICTHAFYLLEGCIRYYTVVEGEEHTGQFFFEGSWYSDYDSFLSQMPSKQYIETLEKTKVAMLSKKTLEHLYTKIPKFERFGRLMAERAYLGARKKNETLTLLSAEERYLHLIQQRPKVVERVPQHYIASYLGIKPPSLSRIRKRLAQNR